MKISKASIAYVALYSTSKEIPLRMLISLVLLNFSSVFTFNISQFNFLKSKVITFDFKKLNWRRFKVT